jgi:alkanesulfonate monooxygenase SsuD/methylene tetrahydromethanopterin reductase-like flavin-dependent oxidoreductase (luciferase family)
MPLHEPGLSPAVWLERDLRQIEILDRLAFAEAWIGEHNATPWEPLASSEIFIAAALQRTKQIRLGTGVSCLPHHHPVQLANRIALLDHMARGRFNWGIGTSGFHESEVFDIDWRENEHRRMFGEVLEGVLDLWADPKPGRRDYGRLHYSVVEPNAPLTGLHLKPYQLPHPPIAIACVTPTSQIVVLAGDRGWIPMSLNIFGQEILRLNWETYANAAVAAGREVDRGIWRISREVFVGETSAKARERAMNGPIAHSWRETTLPTARHFGMPSDAITGSSVSIDWDDIDSLLEYCLEHIWVVGDVDEVTEKLNTFQRDVEGFGTLLVISQDWRDDEAWERSMTLLAEQVLPGVRDVNQSSHA